MKRYHLIVVAIALALAGCGQAAGSLPVNAGTQTARTQTKVAKTTLLYTGRGTTLSVYLYPSLHFVKNFDIPHEAENINFLCSDAQGNVFVPAATPAGESSTSAIYEYAHGSSVLVRTLNLPAFYAYACAVDPLTGNLAVAGFTSFSPPKPSVAIFPNASGEPTFYSSPDFDLFLSAAYDGNSNLFLTGQSYNQHSDIAELAQGGSQLEDVSFQGINPGTVFWDGTSLAIEYVQRHSRQRSTIFIGRFQVSNYIPTVTGITDLGETKRSYAQMAFAKTHLIAAQYTAYLAKWPYPAGGHPHQKLAFGHGAKVQFLTLSVPPSK